MAVLVKCVLLRTLFDTNFHSFGGCRDFPFSLAWGYACAGELETKTQIFLRPAQGGGKLEDRCFRQNKNKLID